MPHSAHQWGTMEVDEILHQTQPGMRRLTGFLQSSGRELPYFAAFFKWILVDWLPEQPVGLPLPGGFKIPHSQRFEFAYEKAQLLKILEAEWNARTADAWKPHNMFRKVTPREWGKPFQIHVDYHLRQFAA